jgi:restriction system protein
VRVQHRRCAADSQRVKADPPMSEKDLREWEKRNRESMKILEKTTPELETAPTR